MADIKWIKITTDIFDDEKILLIESMPEADAIIVIWFKLLSFAGKSNNNGVFMLNNKIAYTDEMLATVFRRPLNIVRLALSTFENFEMIVIQDGAITIPNWEKHQNIDGMERIRQKTKDRVAKFREKQKLLACNVTSNVTVTSCNAIEKDKEKEKDKDKDKDKERIDYQLIVDMYNDTCVSFPKVKALSATRIKAIRARLNTYSIDDFKTLFNKAEASDFLKGKNSRDWQATFDWLIKDANMAKVLDGNYDNKKESNVSDTTRQQVEQLLARQQEQARAVKEEDIILDDDMF